MPTQTLSTEEMELIALCEELIETIRSENYTTRRFSKISNTAFSIYRKSVQVEPYVDPSTIS